MSERKAREFWFEERINSDSLDWFVHNINQRGIVPNESMIRVREVLPNESSEIERLKAENERLKQNEKYDDSLVSRIGIRNMSLIEEIDRLRAALSLAEDLMTHPFLYSEQALRDPSLKARWDRLNEAILKIEKDE